MTTLNDATPEVTVKELTVEEGRALFERAAMERLGVSAEDFLRLYDAEDIPESWSLKDVQAVEFMLPFYVR